MGHDMNCISYAMGVDDSINELSSQGFEIVPDDEDYKVKFNSVNSDIWESYIREHIKDTYWNEYINLNTMDITFLIKENDEITRVVNHNFEEDDILLQSCNRLCEQNFKTIKDLIYSCSFYKEAIENNPFKLKFDNPNIYMRPATEDDVDNMYDWEMESIDKSLQEDPKVQQLIRDDCYQSIKDTQMIMDQDKTIGMFTACMIDNGELRYIGEIYLIPEYRGQHIGSTILKNEIANYDRIRLQVAFDNASALRLYKSLGFKIVSSNKKGGLYIMEYDKNSQDSSIKKVTLDDEYKTLYFGSKNEIDDVSIQLQNDELFVTPFITLASIFAVRPRSKDINLPRGSYNYGYDEWGKPIKVLSQETEPLSEVHVIIEGLPDLKPFDYNSSGFIYVIDVEDVKDHLYQKDWMDDQREYIIKDLESVPIQKVIPVDAVCHIRGGDKMAEPVTEVFFKEAYLKAKERNALDNSDFALVYKDDRSGKTIRKYPIHDEAHVKAAAKMFPRGVPDEYKEKVAKKILRAAHSYDIDTSGWNSVNKAAKNKESHVNEAAVSGGAYTSKGINWANVQPVTMVYKRFSTKNREQMEPIKRFWEISDKYFPEPSMTSGFGWDWTGWETDFAYGIIINDKKVPPEFMEELKQEFPDIILDENFLIPINYEEVYECSFEEMDATYDKIWSKGFLECEYEQYPALGRMKISVIYKKDADKLNSDISKYIKTVPTVKGYRFTLQDKNVGIYEELKRIMYNETNSPDTWEEFKKSPACSWLPSPPSYGEDNKSYFTKMGYDKFMSDTWPVLTKYINDDTIDCEEVDIPVTQIVYQDDYQFITGSPLEESNTERKNLIMKEQVTKILEAYNSGVLTQEEAVEKIEAIQEGASEKYPWDNLAKELKTLLTVRDANSAKGKDPSDYEDKINELKGYIKKYIDKYNKEHNTNLEMDVVLYKDHGIDISNDVKDLMKRSEKYNESYVMNNLRVKQDKIMESFKMGIINGTEGMRLIERVMMEADYITEEEDTAYEGDDNNEPEDITPADTDGDTSDSADSNIESLADYINSLDASERADLLAKINTDVATPGDADSSDNIENNDDTTADDLTPPDGETEEPTADGDTDAEPEVETESAKAIKEPDERLINAYKNVSLDDMEV